MAVKMTKIRLLFLGILTVITVFSSCYYDKQEDLYGNSPCVTNGLTYTKDISVIINQSCVGCHGATNPSAGISLHDYNTVVDCINNGKFVGSVKQDGSASNMPKGGSKWNNCQLSKLDAWIKGGMVQ